MANCRTCEQGEQKSDYTPEVTVKTRPEQVDIIDAETFAGTGEWRLTGNNTYSGATNVDGGTLIVNGKHTGTGAVTVAANATLAGKGSLAAAVTMNGTLQVGDTLATDKGLTFNGGLKLGSKAVLKLNEAMAEAKHYDVQAVTMLVPNLWA